MPQVSHVCSAKICLLNKVFVQNSPSKGDAEWLFQSWLIGPPLFFKWKDSQDMLILRSHLLNSWLIIIRVLIWQCVKAWGSHITGVLLLEKGQFVSCQRWTCTDPGLELETTIWESGSVAVDCLPVRCNQECISPSAWSSLHPEDVQRLRMCRGRDRGLQEWNLYWHQWLHPNSYSSEMSSSQVLHFCTVQIALWIWTCNLELFPAGTSTLEELSPRVR